MFVINQLSFYILFVSVNDKLISILSYHCKHQDFSDFLILEKFILLYGDGSDMRICTVVPVQISLHINGIANLQIFHSLVDVCAAVTQIGFHAESIGLAVLGYVEVQVAVGVGGAGVVVVINESAVIGLAVFFIGLHGHALEGYELVLVFDQFILLSKQICHIGCGCGIAAVLNFDGCAFCYFHLAGPLALVAGHFDLCAGGQLLVVSFGTSCTVDEVCAVLILGVESCLILPPGLLCLYIGFDHNLAVESGVHVLGVGHNALRLLVSAGISAIPAGSER